MSPFVLAWNESVNGDRQATMRAAFGEPATPARELADSFISDLGHAR
jgi:maleylacetate reductase